MNSNIDLLCCASLLLIGVRASLSVVDVPDALKPGANESLSMVVPAKGVQIYECRAKKDAVARIRMGLRRAGRRTVRCTRQHDRPARRGAVLAGQRRQPDRRQR